MANAEVSDMLELVEPSREFNGEKLTMDEWAQKPGLHGSADFLRTTRENTNNEELNVFRHTTASG